jgi:hypothetical protein
MCRFTVPEPVHDRIGTVSTQVNQVVEVPRADYLRLKRVTTGSADINTVGSIAGNRPENGQYKDAGRTQKCITIGTVQQASQELGHFEVTGRRKPIFKSTFTEITAVPNFVPITERYPITQLRPSLPQRLLT